MINGRKWKEKIDADLKSLWNRRTVGPVVRTPNGVKPVAHKWILSERIYVKMKKNCEMQRSSCTRVLTKT